MGGYQDDKIRAEKTVTEIFDKLGVTEAKAKQLLEDGHMYSELMQAKWKDGKLEIPELIDFDRDFNAYP